VGVVPTSPGTAWVVSQTDYTIAWPEVTARAHARLQLRSDPGTYAFALELDVYEDDVLIRSRRWDRTVPRRLQ